MENSIKAQAQRAPEAEGRLSMSDAVRLFLRRVMAEQPSPLELNVLNAGTRAAMQEARAAMAARKGR